jgi:hypothetical protein
VLERQEPLGRRLSTFAPTQQSQSTRHALSIPFSDYATKYPYHLARRSRLGMAALARGAPMAVPCYTRPEATRRTPSSPDRASTTSSAGTAAPEPTSKATTAPAPRSAGACSPTTSTRSPSGPPHKIPDHGTPNPGPICTTAALHQRGPPKPINEYGPIPAEPSRGGRIVIPPRAVITQSNQATASSSCRCSAAGGP